MADNERQNQNHGTSTYYDNAGYIDDLRQNGAPVEPAPNRFIPRAKPPGSNENSQNDGGLFKSEVFTPIDLGEPRKPSDGTSSIDEEAPGDNRDTWDKPLEFLLSCISMSVGLGNVWRFPATAAKNGGGAFLIPYILVLLFIGRPLYYLEMCLGQFSRYGQVKVWNMAPLFKGVGYGSLVGVICVCSYYCSLIAITVYYFFASFAKTLPWAVCHQDKHPEYSCKLNTTQANLAAFYYNSTVFPQLRNIDDGIGELNWKLSLCLVFAWLLIFLSLVKGVKSSGKVAYFTAIFPYVVILILLIRGVTLKGSWTGMKIFLEPEWSELKNPRVWYSAVEQCFFSLATGFGTIIMFGSYNQFRQNVYRDALIISFMDTFTSLLAGITIFSVIGNVMEESNLEFADIQDSIGGPGLVFVLYPQAIAKFGWAPQLFAVLFFLMFFTLGMGTATALTGTVITIVCDQFENWKRWLVTLVICGAGCLVGLMYVTEGGMFMLDLIDRYGAGFIFYIMAMLECAGISYAYGLMNFCNDIQFMTGVRVGIYWKACWAVIIPFGLLANLLYFLISEPEFTYGGIPYPKIATISGWLLTAFAAILVPIWAIQAVTSRKAPTLKKKFLEALKPTPRWGPQNAKLRRDWLQFRAEKKLEDKKRGIMSIIW